MNPSIILALAFNVISLAALLFIIFAKFTGDISKYRKYLAASAAVYFSGTVLITVIVIVAKKIPVLFAVMSEGMILFVFVVVMFVLIKSIRTIQELTEDAKAGKMRSAEQVKAEDEAFYGIEESEDKEEDQ